MSGPVHASPLRRLLMANNAGDMRSELARALAATLRCTVETAGSLTATLAAVESHPPDAVLIDPSWTDHGSVEMVRALRASSSGSKLVIVVLRAAHLAENAEALREAGADRTFREPMLVRPIALVLLGLTVEKRARLRHTQLRATQLGEALLRRAPLRPAAV